MNRESFWIWSNRAAAIAGIVGLAISVYALFRVNHVEDLVKVAERWKTFEIHIMNPNDKSEVGGHLLQVLGRVEFHPHSSLGVSSVRLLLQHYEIEVVPLVRPLAEPLRWWPQSMPSIADDGTLTATVRIGEEDVGGQTSFELLIIGVPKGAVGRVDTYETLPPHFTQSNVVHVRRIR